MSDRIDGELETDLARVALRARICAALEAHGAVSLIGEPGVGLAWAARHTDRKFERRSATEVRVGEPHADAPRIVVAPFDARALTTLIDARIEALPLRLHREIGPQERAALALAADGLASVATQLARSAARFGVARALAEPPVTDVECDLGLSQQLCSALARLALFREGFSPADAARVLEGDVSECLDALLAGGLVRREGERYRVGTRLGTLAMAAASPDARDAAGRWCAWGAAAAREIVREGKVGAAAALEPHRAIFVRLASAPALDPQIRNDALIAWNGAGYADAPEEFAARLAWALDDAPLSGRAELALVLAECGRALSRADVAVEALEIAQRAASERGDTALLARVTSHRARLRFNQGATSEAESLVRHAIELATAAGDPYERAFAQLVLAICTSQSTHPERARELSEAAARSWDALGGVLYAEQARINAAVLELSFGRIDVALRALRTSAERVERGELLGTIASFLCVAHELAHEPHLARAAIERAVTARAPRWYVALWSGYRGRVRVALGEYEGAIADLELASTQLNSLGAAASASTFMALAAIAHAATGSFDRASGSLKRARALLTDAPRERAEIVALADDVVDRWKAALVAPGQPARFDETTWPTLEGPREAYCSIHLRTMRSTVAAVAAEMRLKVADHETLRLRADGSGWTHRGHRVELGNRAVLRRILGALAGTERTGAWIDHAALVAAGWPGEQMRPDAARNRLHVALAELRRLGLHERLERGPEGYRLRHWRPQATGT